ncbi:hypothetical protein [Methylorubrum salsuginis]|uniref:hypothetical protein n=1 Tax=Methylorubrum salsuginis TaxID=414703 RepID=UPI001041EC3A|nr:hypothetical protein [Methylorubrum salsuginis]
MLSAGFSTKIYDFMRRWRGRIKTTDASKARHKIEITNYTNKTLEVYIEIRPDRYLLKPGELMVINANLEGAPYSIGYCEGSVQVYAGMDFDPEVTINGIAADSDWETPKPD